MDHIDVKIIDQEALEFVAADQSVIFAENPGAEP